jgi:lipoate-protein ligase A
LKELLGDQLPDLETVQHALVDGFSDVLGIEAVAGAISDSEESLAQAYFDDEIGTDAFVTEIDNPGGQDEVFTGSHTSAGGTIDTYVRVEGPTNGVLQRALISGDFFVTPPRTVFDLEAHLKGVRLDEVDDAIDAFFEEHDVDMLSVAPDDFKTSIAAALDARPGHDA